MKKIFEHKKLLLIFLCLVTCFIFSPNTHAYVEFQNNDNTYYMLDFPNEIIDNNLPYFSYISGSKIIIFYYPASAHHVTFSIGSGNSGTSFEFRDKNDCLVVVDDPEPYKQCFSTFYDDPSKLSKTSWTFRSFSSSTGSISYDEDLSSWHFYNSNLDLQNHVGNVVFHPPLVETVGLLPLEALLPTPLTQNLAEIIPTILLTALMIFSALVIPFLIRWVISRLR